MKRIALIMLLILASVALSTSALAESSYTEQKEAKVAGYDGGFFLQSPDKDFRLQLYSRLQFQYLYENQNSEPDTSTFKMRRARFVFLGKMFEKFGFVTLVNHGTSGNSANPNTPFWIGQLNANLHPAFNLSMGHFTMPFGRLEEKSSGKGAFVELPLTASQSDTNPVTGIGREAFGAPTTLGVRVDGSVGPVDYALGIGHGNSWNYVNENKTFQYSGRIVYNIMGKPGYDPSDLAYSETPQLSIGAGVSYDPQDDDQVEIPGTGSNLTLDRSLQFAGDIAFKYKGLSLIGESYLRKLRVATGGFTQDDFGYYAQASYFVMPKKLEIAGRASQIFREGPNNNSYEFGGAVNYYIHGHNVKWQNDFTRVVSYDSNFVSTPSDNATRIPVNRFRSMLTFQI